MRPWNTVNSAATTRRDSWSSRRGLAYSVASYVHQRPVQQLAVQQAQLLVASTLAQLPKRSYFIIIKMRNGQLRNCRYICNVFGISALDWRLWRTSATVASQASSLPADDSWIGRSQYAAGRSSQIINWFASQVRCRGGSPVTKTRAPVSTTLRMYQRLLDYCQCVSGRV